jgi:hypothetical protein
MQGCLGLMLVIDSLDNINFSIDWPIGFVRHPKGWPDSTSPRHVPDVNDKQTSIKPSLSFQANGFSWAFFGWCRLEIQKGFLFASWRCFGFV